MNRIEDIYKQLGGELPSANFNLNSSEDEVNIYLYFYLMPFTICLLSNGSMAWRGQAHFQGDALGAKAPTFIIRPTILQKSALLWLQGCCLQNPLFCCTQFCSKYPPIKVFVYGP